MIAYSVEFLLDCKKMRPSLNPGIVNGTQLNPIRGLSSIEFGNRAKSYSEKQILAIEPNRTFGFRTLDFYNKKKEAGVRVAEINNKFLMYFWGKKYNKYNV